jgi:predicted transposase YbfD/YdcC
MGLGSQNKEQRKHFNKVAKSKWKDNVKTIEDAERIIRMIQESPLTSLDPYAMRKIKELEAYVSWRTGNETYREFLTRCEPLTRLI